MVVNFLEMHCEKALVAVCAMPIVLTLLGLFMSFHGLLLIGMSAMAFVTIAGIMAIVGICIEWAVMEWKWSRKKKEMDERRRELDRRGIELAQRLMDDKWRKMT